MSDSDISVKGLDDFAKQFLSGAQASPDEEHIYVAGGQKASEAALAKYFEERKTDFIKRAGSFTEDLMAFFIEQKKMRELSDRESIFALALASIQLRHAYGYAEDTNKTAELLEEFDAVCWGAQQFWDANK